VTSADKIDLGLALLGSLVGGFVGYHVEKKTHPVVGVTTGVLVGAILFPGAVEGIKRLK
jgi:hypothetical protein